MSQENNSRLIFSSSKRARSSVEEETRLIENRIKMIKFEADRAEKRISETREKIEELYKTRTRYLEDQHVRNILKEKDEKNQTILQDINRVTREVHHEKMNLTMVELFRMKSNQGKRVRALKEHLKRKAYQQDLEGRRHNRKLKGAVLLSSQQGNARLQLLQDIKKKKARFDYERKVEQEIVMRKMIENQMHLKGQEEKILIARIADFQELQKLAEYDLKSVN